MINLATLKKYWKLIFIIVVPLLASIIPIVIQDQRAYCGFTVIVMCAFWVTEVLPIGVTSLFPIVLYPLFNIAKSNEITQLYFYDTQVLAFGGLVIAIAIESTGLHKRMAYRLMMLFGSRPLWLLLGIMTITALLSMWISNTAATSMMIPIVISVVSILTNFDSTYTQIIVKPSKNKRNSIQDIGVTELGKIENKEKSDDHQTNVTNRDNISEVEFELIELEIPSTVASQNLLKGCLLGVCYSACIGGAATLVGTTPNLLLKAHYDQNYPDAGLNFLTYMAFATPCSIMMVIIAWIVLAVVWFPKEDILFCLKRNNKAEKELAKKRIEEVIKRKYVDLGPMSWAEASITGFFLLAVLLWVTRDLIFTEGWMYFFGGDKYVTDTTSAIFVVILIFIWPKENIFKGNPYENLVSWEVLHRDMPWDVLLLTGGALALAEGFDKSGLDKWIEEIIHHILPSSKELSLIILLIINLIGTEITSNASMAAIFIPIADLLAQDDNIAPKYFLLPITICVSFAFMLPIATPPNALVYGTKRVTLVDYAKSGILIKIIGIFVLFLAANTWLSFIF